MTGYSGVITEDWAVSQICHGAKRGGFPITIIDSYSRALVESLKGMQYRSHNAGPTNVR